jgi:hypothetical protein
MKHESSDAAMAPTPSILSWRAGRWSSGGRSTRGWGAGEVVACLRGALDGGRIRPIHGSDARDAAAARHVARSPRSGRDSPRFPQLNTDGIEVALLERECGVVLHVEPCAPSRRTSETRCHAALGSHRRARHPVGLRSRTHSGEAIAGDHFVFACGAWMPGVFDTMRNRIRPTRQVVTYFGTPAGDPRFTSCADAGVGRLPGRHLWHAGHRRARRQGGDRRARRSHRSRHRRSRARCGEPGAGS